MAEKAIAIGSIFSSVLLVLTVFPPVVAYHQVTEKEKQITPSLAALVKRLPEKQGIITLYLLLTFLFVFIETSAALAHLLNTSDVGTFIHDLEVIFNIAIGWPMIIFILLAIAEFFGFNPHP